MIPPGRIDMHSHLVYGIDDGCQTFDDALTSIARLKQAGYVGTICTPHMWPEPWPDNTPHRVTQWTAALADELTAAGVDYHLWAGGEMRVFKGAVEWMEAHGVPTLGGGNCVLVDVWERKWPRWFDSVIDWLLEEGYQPILAHPERSPCSVAQPKKLTELRDRGVWLQGNFRAMTGEDGYAASTMVRELLRDEAYTFMALDMHTPIDLESRLDGLQLVGMEFGAEVVDQLTDARVRELVIG